jgi:hypothetical protein
MEYQSIKIFLLYDRCMIRRDYREGGNPLAGGV